MICSDNIIDKLWEFFEVFENGPISNKGVVQFYHVPHSTTDKFPQLSHVLMGRDQVIPGQAKPGRQISPMYNYFENIVFDFLDKKNLSHGNVMRACLNLQYAHKLPHTDPHVDYDEDHYVVLIYLNDSNGDTIVYDETHNASKPSALPYNSQLKVKDYITPERGKIVCFDGKHYHANYFPDVGELRLVCVFNIKK